MTQTAPKTLLEHAGLTLGPARLSESVLVIVDAQKDYEPTGKLPLVGITEAIEAGKKVLTKAREAGTPVFHVVQHSKPESPIFAVGTPGAEIIDAYTPIEGEAIVPKTLPSSFAGTNLQELIDQTGRKKLIVMGFMTHMCVSTTVRAAIEHGYFTTLVGGACATRDLPDGNGGIVPASDLHRANIAALRDRFAVVVDTAVDLPI